MRLRLTVLLMPLLLALTSCQSTAPGQVGGVDADLLITGGDGSDWPGIGRTYAEQRHSPLSQINDTNASQLGVAWFSDLDTNRGQEATPIIVNGVMYVSTAWSMVKAFDAASGRELWAFDPQVPREKLVDACCDAVNRGVAVWKGKIYVGTLDGRLIALDAATGKQVWSVQTTSPAQRYSITGAPRVFKDKVVIGNGGSEFGVRGYVTAYDAATGRQLWRFYTVPGDPKRGFENAAMARAAKTWSGEWWRYGGGGTVWDAIVYDPELDQLYLGVGNGSPWNHSVRSAGKGDNLFLSSIVAVDPDTGAYKWHYQQTPGETWDFTATQPIILATLSISGKPTKVLMQAPKNGFFFVLDRTTGKPVVQPKNFVPVTWATGYDPATGRPIENPQARYDKTGKLTIVVPGAMGAHSWQPMAFNPKVGLVYIPANIAGLPYAPAETEVDKTPQPRGFNVALDWAAGVSPRDFTAIGQIRNATTGQLVAWDPVRQRAAWRIDYPTPWNGGVLSTAGNIVVQGDAMGWLHVYRASDGQELWKMPAGSSVMAAPATFAVAGTQYIAVLVGKGGVFALAPGPIGGRFNQIPNVSRVVVLKLGGTAKLPPMQLIEQPPLDPPPVTASAATIKQGHALYARYCSVCHGDSAVSGGVNPDLRYSGTLADGDTWHQILIDGALKDNGMVSFAPVMTAQQAQSIRHYIIDQANWDKQQIDRTGQKDNPMRPR